MRIILTLLFVISVGSSHAQVGITFPDMEAETLTNKMVTIPEHTNGKYSLISLAYSKKSEGYLSTWFQPIYQHFIYKSEQPSLFSIDYDINVYFVPMFTGAKRPAYQKVMKKVQKTVDPKLQPHVLFYKGTINEYKKSLNFQGKDVPYFFLLDPEGKIVYTTAGKYGERKMREIIDKIDASF